MTNAETGLSLYPGLDQQNQNPAQPWGKLLLLVVKYGNCSKGLRGPADAIVKLGLT